MEFSEAFRCSLPPRPSPDGRLLAAAVDYRLIVRVADSLEVVQLFSCEDRVTAIEWSPNGRYVACVQSDRGVVEVWCVADAAWRCKIDEGQAAGVQAASWTPDGRGLLLVADFCTRMVVWRLTAEGRGCTYLPGPKHAAAGRAFSPRDSGGGGGSLLAVLERHDCRDALALYDARSGGSAGAFELRARVPLPTRDAADLAWSPDGRYIAVWDSPLGGTVAVLAGSSSSSSGSSNSGGADAPGRLLASYSLPCGEGLGVRGACSWSPGGDMLAVGGHDGVVRVLGASLAWGVVFEGRHGGAPLDEPPDVAAYREVVDDGGGDGDDGDKGRQQQQQQQAVGGGGGRGVLAPLAQNHQGQAAAAAAAAAAKHHKAGAGAGSGSGSRSRYVVAALPVELPPAAGGGGGAAGQQQQQHARLLPPPGVSKLAWCGGNGALLASVSDAHPASVFVWDLSAGALAAVLVHAAPVRALAWAPPRSAASAAAEGGGAKLAVCTGAPRVYLWARAGASVVHVPLPGFTARGCEWAPPAGDGSSVLVLFGAEAFACAYATARVTKLQTMRVGLR